MFILVNYSNDYGMIEIGRYDTREEAAKEIAKSICNDYGVIIDIDSFISTHRVPNNDNGDFRLDDNNTYVWFNNYECACYNDNYNDHWLIIEA